MSLEKQFKISENIYGSLVYKIHSYEVMVGSKQHIASIEFTLKYQCNQWLRKCHDDFVVVPSVEGKDYSIEIDKVESGGKLKASKEDKNVSVNIDRGKGEGYLRIIYKFFTNPRSEGTYTYTITIFFKIKTGEFRAEEIKFSINAVKPIDKLTIDLEPKSPVYSPGDPISISVKFYSNYEGQALLNINGVVEELSEKIKLAKGEKELFKKLVIRRTKPTYVNVSIKIPEINFEITKKLELIISPVKIRAEIIEIPREIYIGEKASVKLIIANESLISECKLKIKAKIYEYNIEKDITLKPRESKEENLITPIITQKSVEETSGFIEIIEVVTNYSWHQDIKLEKPLLPIVIGIDDKERRIFSSGKYSLSVKVENKLSSSLGISFLSSKPSVCDITLQMNKAILEPYSFLENFVEIKPKSIGKDILKINIVASINGIKIYEHFEEVVIEVMPSFKIVESGIHEIKSTRIIKGQKFRAYLKFKVLTNTSIEVKVLSKNLKFSENSFIIFPPEFEKRLDVIATDYGEAIITLTDGIHSSEVDLPISIVKPEINITEKEKVIYGGLRNILKFEVENPYNVDLKLSIKTSEEYGFLRLLTGEKEIYLKANSKDIVEFEAIGLKSAEKIRLNLSTNVLPIIEEIKEKYEFSKEILLSIKHPIESKINISEVYIPLLDKTDIISKELNIPVYITIFVENMTNYPIDNLEVNLKFKELPVEYASYKERRSLEPKSNTSFEIPHRIPYDYEFNLLTLCCKILIAEQYVAEDKEIKVDVVKYVPVVLEFNRNEFKHKSCLYPYLVLRDKVILFTPIDKNLNDVYTKCGKPIKISEYHFELANLIFNIFSNYIRKGIVNVWDATSSLLFKRTLQFSLDFTKEQKIYEKLTFTLYDMDILPAILWRATLSKLMSGKIEKYDMKTEKAGLLIFHSESQFQSFRNDFYIHLSRFIFNKNSESELWLYNYIKNNVENLIIEPIYLLYMINGGKFLEFNEKIYKLLLDRKDHSGLITYLALSNISQWIFNEELVHKIKEIISEKSSIIISKNNSKVALLIILREMLSQLQKKIVEVKSHEL
jgi:hypothetical protein